MSDQRIIIVLLTLIAISTSLSGIWLVYVSWVSMAHLIKIRELLIQINDLFMGEEENG